MSGGMLARVWAGTAWVVRHGGAGKGGVPGRASESERKGNAIVFVKGGRLVIRITGVLKAIELAVLGSW